MAASQLSPPIFSTIPGCSICSRLFQKWLTFLTALVFLSIGTVPFHLRKSSGAIGPQSFTPRVLPATLSSPARWQRRGCRRARQPLGVASAQCAWSARSRGPGGTTAPALAPRAPLPIRSGRLLSGMSSHLAFSSCAGSSFSEGFHRPDAFRPSQTVECPRDRASGLFCVSTQLLQELLGARLLDLRCWPVGGPDCPGVGLVPWGWKHSSEACGCGPPTPSL